MGRERGEGVEDGEADDGRHQERAPAQAVGEEQEEEGGHDAQAREGVDVAPLLDADVQRRPGVRRREGEHRGVEAVEERGGGEQEEEEDQVAVEARGLERSGRGARHDVGAYHGARRGLRESAPVDTLFRPVVRF